MPSAKFCARSAAAVCSPCRAASVPRADRLSASFFARSSTSRKSLRAAASSVCSATSSRASFPALFTRALPTAFSPVRTTPPKTAPAPGTTADAAALAAASKPQPPTVYSLSSGDFLRNSFSSSAASWAFFS